MTPRQRKHWDLTKTAAKWGAVLLVLSQFYSLRQQARTDRMQRESLANTVVAMQTDVNMKLSRDDRQDREIARLKEWKAQSTGRGVVRATGGRALMDTVEVSAERTSPVETLGKVISAPFKVLGWLADKAFGS